MNATEIDLQLTDLEDLNLDKDIMQLVSSESVNGVLRLYKVNKNTVVSPVFYPVGGFNLTHVKDLNCTQKNCKSIKTPQSTK